MKALGLVLVCTVAVTSFPYSGRRLIQIHDEPPSWVDPGTLSSLIRDHVNFMDITGKVFPTEPILKASTGIPEVIRFQETVREANELIQVPRMREFLVHFNGYFNRYYRSRTGIESAEWLLSQVSTTIQSSGYAGNATVKTFSHSWPQKSVIARIEGSDPELKTQVVIIGAHMDSINSTDPQNGMAQGADDNGSGSTVILETLRILLEAGFIPKRSVEFHWYAAEEVGLLGSLDIAEYYYNQMFNVVGMVNFDVVGYYVEGREEIALYTDYTDERLTNFIKLVVENYLSFNTWFYRECKARCSDHASWHQYGFPSVFNKEAVSSPFMHTIKDTIETVNFRQVAEFVKLAVGYCIEVGEPSPFQARNSN